LQYLDRRTVARFDDLSYRWVELKRFSVDPDRAPHDILAALIEHPEYHDTFLGSEAEPSENVHGPYRLDMISADTYREVDGPDCVAVFREWMNVPGTVPDAHVEGDLREVLTLIEAADRCYRLADLGEHAQNDVGWIIGDFLELIVITRASCELSLVIGAAD
jgi:hypothetical protein